MRLASSGRITRYPGVEESSHESSDTIGEENSFGNLACAYAIVGCLTEQRRAGRYVRISAAPVEGSRRCSGRLLVHWPPYQDPSLR
jgi:hypothetical protein